MPTAALSLLGEFRLLVGARPVSVPSKGIELLAFLAIYSTQGLRKDKVSGILWPDYPEERALANLATTLWRVKLALKGSAQGLISKATGGLQLNRQVVSADLWEFEDCIARISAGDPDISLATKAISLYKGSILESGPDAPWLSMPRERAQRAYLRVLQTYAEHAAMKGKLSEAIQAYEQALVTDPFNDGLCRAAMRVYLAEGNRTKSLQTFLTFQRRLAEELNVDPEPETQHLFNKIKNANLGVTLGSIDQAYGTAPTAPNYRAFFGRQNELVDLHELLSRAERGEAQWIGVEGEVGIGKTRLIHEICRSARAKGWAILSCQPPEFPQSVAYSLLREMLSGFPGAWNEIETFMRQKPPDKSGLLQPGGIIGGSLIDNVVRQTCSEVIAARMKHEVDQTPMAIVLEDLHFSDHASLDLILSLQKRLRHSRLFVILSWRAGECPKPLSSSCNLERQLLRVMTLSRLEKPYVRMICEDYLGEASSIGDVVDFVYRESEGNPLFAVECIKAIGQKAQEQPHGKIEGFRSRPSFDVRQVQVPGRFRAYVVRRLRKLPREGVRLATTSAACGREIEPVLMSRVLQVPLKQVLSQLNKLVKNGFVAQHGERFEFVHDKIRQVCYEQIPVSKWIQVHGRINTTLEVDYPDRLEALAFHSGRAGFSHKAAVYWERIGDQADKMWAHSDAGRAYTMAHENLQRHGVGKGAGDHRFQILGKRARVFEHVGELEKGFADVTSMLDLASQLGDEKKRCEALTLQARLLLRQGSFSLALEHARVTTYMSQSMSLTELEAESREVAALAMYRLGNHQFAEQELDKLRKVLESANDTEGLERVWNNLGRVQVVQGRYLEALASLERAEQLGTGNANHRAMRSLFRGIAQGYLGRGTEAILDLQLAARDFMRVGNTSGAAVTNAYLASFSVSKGDLVSAIHSARRGLPFKAGRTEPRWGWNSASVLSYSFWLVLGNYRRARRAIAKFMEYGTTLGNAGLLLDTAAAIALEEGHHEAALSLAGQAVERLARDRSASADALLTLGRCYLAIRAPDRAFGVLSKASAICEGAGEGLNLPRVLSFLSVAERELGLSDLAFAHSERAVAILTENSEFAYLPQDVYWNHYTLLRANGTPTSLGMLDRAYRLVMKYASQLGRVGKSRFLSVKVNREICEAWERALGPGQSLGRPIQMVEGDLCHYVVAAIPTTRAPKGKRLRANDLIEVTWTVDAGHRDRDSVRLIGDIGLRRARILRLCAEARAQGGNPREDDLARVLGVTTRTIRSDIAHLRAQGCHVHTRGTRLL